MIDTPPFGVDPWAVVESELDLERLAHTEAIFALSNGHLGLCGNLDEGEPHVAPGTYLNGFFESLPLPYAEAGYGYPEQGQSLIDVTNGKLMRLLVDDEPFDVRYGTLRRHDSCARPARRCPPARGRVDFAGWTSGSHPLDSAGLVRPASDRCRSATRSRPSDERAASWCSPCSSPTSRCPRDDEDPRAAAALRSPLVSEYHAHPISK